MNKEKSVYEKMLEIRLEVEKMKNLIEYDENEKKINIYKYKNINKNNILPKNGSYSVQELVNLYDKEFLNPYKIPRTS